MYLLFGVGAINKQGLVSASEVIKLTYSYQMHSLSLFYCHDSYLFSRILSVIVKNLNQANDYN